MNAAMPTALHMTWSVVVDEVIVEIALPGFPLRPDSCSR